MGAQDFPGHFFAIQFYSLSYIPRFHNALKVAEFQMCQLPQSNGPLTDLQKSIERNSKVVHVN
jgi:hypothetical protein